MHSLTIGVLSHDSWVKGLSYSLFLFLSLLGLWWCLRYIMLDSVKYLANTHTSFPRLTPSICILRLQLVFFLQLFHFSIGVKYVSLLKLFIFLFYFLRYFVKSLLLYHFLPLQHFLSLRLKIITFCLGWVIRILGWGSISLACLWFI